MKVKYSTLPIQRMSESLTTNCSSIGDDASPIDENEEWAKIADIVASFGGGIGRDPCRFSESSEDEQDCKKVICPLKSVSDWLASLQLAQYENVLAANGFDDMSYMGADILEEDDLSEIGIVDSNHRTELLNAAKLLPTVASYFTNHIPVTVEEWLFSLHLEDYIDVFLAKDFTSMERVKHIWELELNTVLDVILLGHRKRILASLKGFPNDRKVNGDTFHSVKLNSNSDLLSSYSSSNGDYENINDSVFSKSCSRLTDVAQDRRSMYNSYSEEIYNGDIMMQSDIRQKELLRIRPPHLAHAESPIKQWRHQPEVLIKGCCKYTAHYLGSTLVRQLQGTESTKESIHRLKNSTYKGNSLPAIDLAISYKGVKFIETNTKKVVCEHEIGNIFCACQDADDMNYFAYITKDLETCKHYCHVFSVKSSERAGEIILTLGEAFEIAYQLALREKEDGSITREHIFCQTDSIDSSTFEDLEKAVIS